jgi:hypothetical protein
MCLVASKEVELGLFVLILIDVVHVHCIRMMLTTEMKQAAYDIINYACNKREKQRTYLVHVIIVDAQVK